MKTTRAPLPYANAPLTAQDIIQERVNFEAQLMERQTLKESVIPPSVHTKIPQMKYTSVGANWAKANILMRTFSMFNPFNA